LREEEVVTPRVYNATELIMTLKGFIEQTLGQVSNLLLDTFFCDETLPIFANFMSDYFAIFQIKKSNFVGMTTF